MNLGIDMLSISLCLISQPNPWAIKPWFYLTLPRFDVAPLLDSMSVHLPVADVACVEQCPDQPADYEAEETNKPEA
jgi:hypothetical protein